jgi:hypothetical protein
MIGRRKIRIYIRLAAIPQPLAKGSPFKIVHQAVPAMAATTASNNTKMSRLLRVREA